MKNLFIFILAAIGLFTRTVAQDCPSCFQNPQPVIITTEPDKAATKTAITDACRPKYQKFYQKNRFKWYFPEETTAFYYKVRPNTGTGGTPTINPLLVPSLNTPNVDMYKYLNKEGGTVPDNQPSALVRVLTNHS